MWPFRFVTIFRNRWWTLAFAAMVCWMAASTVGAPDDASNTANASEAELEAVKDAFAAIQAP